MGVVRDSPVGDEFDGDVAIEEGEEKGDEDDRRPLKGPFRAGGVLIFGAGGLGSRIRHRREPQGPRQSHAWGFSFIHGARQKRKPNGLSHV